MIAADLEGVQDWKILRYVICWGRNCGKKVGDGSLVISGCSGCILQLCLTGDSLKVYHWLELFEF